MDQVWEEGESGMGHAHPKPGEWTKHVVGRKESAQKEINTMVW